MLLWRQVHVWWKDHISYPSKTGYGKGAFFRIPIWNSWVWLTASPTSHLLCCCSGRQGSLHSCLEVRNEGLRDCGVHIGILGTKKTLQDLKPELIGNSSTVDTLKIYIIYMSSPKKAASKPLISQKSTSSLRPSIHRTVLQQRSKDSPGLCHALTQWSWALPWSHGGPNDCSFSS